MAFDWQQEPPEAHGLIPDRLEMLWRGLEQRGTKSLLIVRHDRIVLERYAEDWGPEKKHYSASLAKAVVGGLSLMLTMDDGRIHPDDFAYQYVPQWRNDPLRSQIRVRHLATHSSGIEDAELSEGDRALAHAEGKTLTDHHMALPGWKGAFWRKEPDPFTLARDQAPVVFPPGSQYAYSNPGMAMLAYCVTAALQGSETPDIRTLLRERVMHPIGVPDGAWSVGYDQVYEVDGLPLVANWGGGSFTARALARVGRLMLHRGVWESKQQIGPAIVHEALRYAGTPVPDRPSGNPQPVSGLAWWLNADGVWPALPRDAFAGSGAGNQLLLVVPSLDLIVVRNGATIGDPERGEGHWGGVEKYLIEPLMASFERRPPYRRSTVITQIDWDPTSQIRRLARGGKRKDGSDNWPITWAEDGNLYTAYGDGYGFEPGVEKKLGLGFGVVIGDPEDFVAYNIRSDGENRSQGASGPKASGLLMVDDILYLWVRNADGKGHGSRLGWSTDHARHWEWCDWRFEEFGHPTFINYGQNYTGARDDYVYVVSHDDPSAYLAADRFILMRVPKEHLRERDAYGFFVKLGSDGNPIWSTSIEERGAVFRNPGYCGRSSMSYDAGLGRYLWWQSLRRTGEQAKGREGIDTRFEGGFGIYDAPEPWGPWTTVYFTDRWDVGPGELGCFPTKWMSTDGRTLYLVFSGEDNFAVRRCTMRVSAE